MHVFKQCLRPFNFLTNYSLSASAVEELCSPFVSSLLSNWSLECTRPLETSAKSRASRIFLCLAFVADCTVSLLSLVFSAAFWKPLLSLLLFCFIVNIACLSSAAFTLACWSELIAKLMCCSSSSRKVVKDLPCFSCSFCSRCCCCCGFVSFTWFEMFSTFAWLESKLKIIIFNKQNKTLFTTKLHTCFDCFLSCLFLSTIQRLDNKQRRGNRAGNLLRSGLLFCLLLSGICLLPDSTDDVQRFDLCSLSFASFI